MLGLPATISRKVSPCFLWLWEALKCFRRPLSQMDAAMPCPFAFQLTLQSELPHQMRADKVTVIMLLPVSMKCHKLWKAGFFQPIYTSETAASSNKRQSHNIFCFQFSLYKEFFSQRLYLYLKRNKSIFNVYRLMHCSRKREKHRTLTQCFNTSLCPQQFYLSQLKQSWSCPSFCNITLLIPNLCLSYTKTVFRTVHKIQQQVSKSCGWGCRKYRCQRTEHFKKKSRRWIAWGVRGGSQLYARQAHGT